MCENSSGTGYPTNEIVFLQRLAAEEGRFLDILRGREEGRGTYVSDFWSKPVIIDLIIV